MKLGSIPDPFAGEKLAEIYPRLAPFIDPEQTPHLGRLHYFPGRHLTDVALGQEQAVRVQRLALRGRAVTGGVVQGLELTWRTLAGGVQFQLRPGHALTASGHDLVVDRTVEFAYEDLKLFDATLQQVSEFPLGILDDAPISAWAGVLVLQPGFADDADLPLAAQEGHGTDFTPCPRVPEDEVYYKTSSTDAARLVLYPLPWDEPPGPLWQNRVAWSIFNREALGQQMPWLELGVPLAVIGFNDSLFPDWIDRHAVVRPAGKPRQRVLIQPTFDARIWPARFEQFCDQLSHLTDPLAASELCQFLSPVGLLPRTYLDLQKTDATASAPAVWQLTQRFFPKGYTVDAAVVPLEQLDALIADSVRLQPYDLSHLDAVRLLLPVSQRWFDPDLLKIEVIDPQFDHHIKTYREVRGDWLARRSDLAQRRRALEVSIGATPTEYPLTPDAADPKRLESPEQPIAAPPGEASQYEVSRTNATPPVYASLLLAHIRQAGAAFLKTFTLEDQNEFKALFTACGITAAEVTAGFAPAAVPAWLAGFSANGTDATLDEAERKELRRELLAYIKKQVEVQAAEAAQVQSSNLKQIIAYFAARADEADELVDAGFLKARTDVFRLGTLLSNNSLATKFVASPSLANVVDRKPAKADTAGVNNFASQLLANFAPSAIGSAASPATTIRSLSFNAMSSADSGINRALGPSAGSGMMNLNLGKTFDAGSIIGAISDSGIKLEQNRNTLDAIVDKLTPDEQHAFNELRTTAEGLTSAGMLNQLQGIAEVGKFADNFVANFDKLSQKQIRAIPLDRLQPALAPTVRKEIHDGRLEIFERLTRLGISLGDLTTDFVDVPGTPVRPKTLPPEIKLTRLRFQTLISRRRFDSLILIKQGADAAAGDQVSDADESQHFATGVSYADMAMSALRAVETRIKEYRAFIEQCRAALTKSEALIKQISTALTPVEIELEEARQDVAVALALRDEEQARLDRINAHREKVLREHVDFLVFHRPRAVHLNIDVPSRVIEPALTTEPVIECLREKPSPPADLAALRDIFRASPARWFKHAPKWLAQVDRWEHLRSLVERASKTTLAALDQPTLSSGRYTQTLNRVFQARQAAAQKFIAAAPLINVAALSTLSWRDLRDHAGRQLTLGQLIASGPAGLSKAAAEELENIFAVTTCLHENFSRVPGLIRLDWAEKFGQFDNVVVDFRDLSRLPGWRKIDFTLRREMQIHADWIFGRIEQDAPDALDLINDLIRVALLLASHAPVDQLIVGHPIESEVTPRPGLLLNLKVDPLRIRRGMTVTYKVSETQILRAVVEDISASHVAARVLDVPALNGGTLKLTPSSTFYFR